MRVTSDFKVTKESNFIQVFEGFNEAISTLDAKALMLHKEVDWFTLTFERVPSVTGEALIQMKADLK